MVDLDVQELPWGAALVVGLILGVFAGGLLVLIGAAVGAGHPRCRPGSR